MPNRIECVCGHCKVSHRNLGINKDSRYGITNTSCNLHSCDCKKFKEA